MFPGFGFGGISKADLISMTYPQFKNLLKSLDRIEKDKEEFQSEIPHGSLNDMIQGWRKEKDADNEHSDTSS